MFLAGEQWRDFFDSMQREAFRLETLPVYRVPQEATAFQQFLAGEQLSSEVTAAWTDRLRMYAASGRIVCRVHLVKRPLSDYLRFEFEHYRHNVDAGEQVRILDITDRPNPGLPDQDFWLFDESHVVLMHYEPDGTQVSRELLAGDHEPYVRWKELALAESVPFSDYYLKYCT